MSSKRFKKKYALAQLPLTVCITHNKRGEVVRFNTELLNARNSAIDWLVQLQSKRFIERAVRHIDLTRSLAPVWQWHVLEEKYMML